MNLLSAITTTSVFAVPDHSCRAVFVVLRASGATGGTAALMNISEEAPFAKHAGPENFLVGVSGLGDTICSVGCGVG